MALKNSIRLLIASTSTIYGSSYLAYLKRDFAAFIATDEVLFVPFAQPSGISCDDYTDQVRKALAEEGIKVRGLHEFEHKQEAIRQSKAIFIGGGNTFLLLQKLYEYHLIEVIRECVLAGLPYVGTSAGSNILGLTIGTTNDMPIVYPPSFESLGLVPFNINPHYLDPDPHSKHKGETRETRIMEFHQLNDQPVVGLREGSYLIVENGQITLHGDLSLRLFRKNQLPQELSPGIIKF